MISKINKTLRGSPLQNFVPNYKNLATVYQVFNGNLPPKKRVLLEEKLVEDMASLQGDKQEHQPISNLAFKMFAKKFNEIYSDGLLTEQKTLLGCYINSFMDNGVELKIYLQKDPIVCKGKVLWVQEKEGYVQDDVVYMETGISFLDLDEETKRLIKECARKLDESKMALRNKK